MNRFTNLLIRSISGSALFITVIVSSGCASPARVEQMQVASPLATRVAIAGSPLKEQVAIKDVTGGRETNPMWVSNVSSSDFERALEASLRDAGLLSANRQSGRYQLVAHLLKLDQPFAGFSMTVTATVQYALVERSTGQAAWERTITTPYTAQASDAFLGSERLKLANEGAARANIEKLVEAIVTSSLLTTR